MSAFFTYLLQVAIIQILLLAFYWLFLYRDTFYKIIRSYFIGGLIFSYILPLIPFNINNTRSIAVNTMASDVMYDYIPNLNFANIAQPHWWAQYSINHGVLAVIFIGAVALLISFAVKYISLKQLRFNIYYKCKNYVIFTVDAPIKPFSFGKHIYLNPELHNNYELDEIIQHELVHVQQRHSFDIIISTINKCLFWWNPAAWLLNKSIRNNLEYIVDNEMLQLGFDRKHYQYHLLYISQLAYSNSIANHFNLSNLKKRIKMMNKEKTNAFYKAKCLLLAPLTLLVLISFNLKNLNAADITFDNDVADSTETKVVIKGFNLDKSSPNDKPLIILDGKEIAYNSLKEKMDETQIKAIDFLSKEDAIKQYGDKAKNGVLLIYAEKEPPANGARTSAKKHALKGDMSKMLYIFDGQVVDASELEKLDSKDVKSISVLKGETATELYGDKAKNGAILIHINTTPPENNSTVKVYVAP